MNSEHYIAYDLLISIKDVQQLINLILDSTTIAIISHKNPDGDTIGSGVALFHMLTNIGKQCTLHCIDPIPRKVTFLQGTKYYTTMPPKGVDLCIVVDTNTVAMTGFDMSTLIKNQTPIFFIDHHPQHKKQNSLINTAAASTTCLLFCIAKLLSVPICLDTATALLVGIYWDTGGFIHGNTSFHAYRIASILVEMGANPHEITEHLFRSNTIPQLRLWGKAITQAKWMNNRKVLRAILREEDFLACDAETKDLEGAIDHLNTIPESKWTMLLTEYKTGIRGSLRSRDTQVNLTPIAKSLGGGGHAQAAGFSLPGYIEKQYRWKLQITH